MERFCKDEDGRYVWCDESEAEYAFIDIEKYNGLRKALRIVRDRALQQIDKQIADEHGYRLVRAARVEYSRSSTHKVWKITKSTPYSIKLGIEEAAYLIKQDMVDYYKLRPFPLKVQFGKIVRMTYEDVAYEIECYCEREIKDEDWLRCQERNKRVTNFIEEYDGLVVTEPIEYSTNIGQGVYEVTYYASKL